MSFVMNAPGELARRMEEEAARRALSVEELKEIVAEAVNGAQTAPVNGAELVAAWRRAGVIGAWAGRPEISNSVAYAESLRRAAEKR